VALSLPKKRSWRTYQEVFFRRIAAVEDSQCESFDPLDG